MQHSLTVRPQATTTVLHVWYGIPTTPCATQQLDVDMKVTKNSHCEP
jgi:hypothetical protein